VAGAFKSANRKVAKIKGKNILLVDDVLTTGATLKAATKALKKAGAEQINVIVLARVVRATDISH
jgi:predicted amidophosphoribosyltransferase